MTGLNDFVVRGTRGDDDFGVDEVAEAAGGLRVRCLDGRVMWQRIFADEERALRLAISSREPLLVRAAVARCLDLPPDNVVVTPLAGCGVGDVPF